MAKPKSKTFIYFRRKEKWCPNFLRFYGVMWFDMSVILMRVINSFMFSYGMTSRRDVSIVPPFFTNTYPIDTLSLGVSLSFAVS